jgi:hypothetical protein
MQDDLFEVNVSQYSKSKDLAMNHEARFLVEPLTRTMDEESFKT